MTKHRILSLLIPATIGLASLGATAPAHAAPLAAQVNVAGHCTGTSRSVLQANREDNGTLSVDFSIDMARHRAGVAWKLTLADNGTTFASGTKRTGPDGSLDFNRSVNPKPGANTISAKGTNPTTGETCTATATL
jgi:hypothetical protein